MTEQAAPATQVQGNGANDGGPAPPWTNWYWLAVPIVMIGLMCLMAVGAFTGGHGVLTGGHWHCF